MNRQHAVALAYLASFAFAYLFPAPACLGQQNEPAIYANTRSTTLTPAVEADTGHLIQPAASQPSAAQSTVTPSFPSLRPRAGGAANDGEGQGTDKKSSKIAAPTITVISSLAIVLGLFAALVWGSRRFGNGSQVKGSIPKEVLQTLGSTALDPRTRVTMLRCGNRILIVAQTGSGVHSLGEIVQPEEVRRLTAACLGNSKEDFAETLNEIEQERAPRGFAGSANANANANAPSQPRRSLFASA